MWADHLIRSHTSEFRLLSSITLYIPFSSVASYIFPSVRESTPNDSPVTLKIIYCNIFSFIVIYLCRENHIDYG